MKHVLLAALLSLPASAVAQVPTVDGTWHIDGDISGNPVVSTCVLAEKDAKITGTCTGVDAKPVQVTGTVKEKAISWSYDTIYQGGVITLSYTATRDKDGNLTGSVTVPQYSATGDFTAKRDAPAAKP